MIVKTGDTYPITFTTGGYDLTGATVRLLARRVGDTTTTVLPSTVTDAAGGVITHTLTGTLTAGTYDIEAEVTKAGEVVTFPTAQDDGTPMFLRMRVVPDLG